MYPCIYQLWLACYIPRLSELLWLAATNLLVEVFSNFAANGIRPVSPRSVLSGDITNTL